MRTWGWLRGFTTRVCTLGSMLAPPVTDAMAGLIGIPASFRVIAVVLPVLYYLAFFAVRFRRRVPERERRSTPTPVP